MTEATKRTYGIWMQGAAQLSALGFIAAAATTLVQTPDLQQDSFALELLLLISTLALVRRFGIQLPGKGFASFDTGVVLIALLLRSWPFAVLVAAFGLLAGDLLLRRQPIRHALIELGHLVTGSGIAGIVYTATGGSTGEGVLTASNLPPLIITLLLVPVLSHTSRFAERALSQGFAKANIRLTMKWESLVIVSSAGLALGWVTLAVSDAPPATVVAMSMALVVAAALLHYLMTQVVAADTLRLVQSLASAIVAERTAAGMLERIKEVVTRLIPWEQMRLARYDSATDELEVLVDTGTEQRFRFRASLGLTGEAVRRGAPVVSNRLMVREVILPEGEEPGSEVLVPLFSGDELMGLWSLRHSDGTMYTDFDAELLGLLAPDLIMATALHTLLSPITESEEQAATSIERLEGNCRAITVAISAVLEEARKAQNEAKRASTNVDQASQNLAELIDGLEIIAKVGRKASETSGNLARTATDLRESNARAVEHLKNLGSSIERGATEMAKLREAADEVEGFSEAIATIANQTNLLSLNATIEAARAGAYGKGFGVVADQVRVLAEESARTARSIGRSAQETRRVIESSAHAMEEVSGRLSEVVQASERWLSELAEIVATAAEARRDGERMRDLPKSQLNLSSQVQAILAKAQTATAASAEDAAAIVSSIDQQAQTIESLSHTATELVTLARHLGQRTSHHRDGKS